MLRRLVLAFSMGVFAVLMSATAASAFTFDPDPPVVGEPTAYSATLTLPAICPDPTGGTVEHYAEHTTSGSQVSVPLTSTVTTDANGDWVITVTGTVTYPEAGTYKGITQYNLDPCKAAVAADTRLFDVVEDAVVPILDPTVSFVAVALAGSSIAGYRRLKK